MQSLQTFFIFAAFYGLTFFIFISMFYVYESHRDSHCDIQPWARAACTPLLQCL